MKIRQVTALYYSATGTTRTVVCRAAEAAARVLNVPWREVSFTTPGERAAQLNFADGDLVICGSPTYAGRLPNKLAPEFRAKWQGNGAAAVAVVTFGNRAFDNSLAELTDLLKQNGFRVLGAGAFVCRHAFTDALAADRPNSDDLALAEELGAAAAEKAASDAPGADVSVPGNPEAPYYIPRGVDGAPAKFLPAKAQVKRELCTGCGRCVAKCPIHMNIVKVMKTLAKGEKQ